MKHPQSPLAARCFASPLKGASPVAGETPATAIAGLACSAALGFFAFHAPWITNMALPGLQPSPRPAV